MKSLKSKKWKGLLALILVFTLSASALAACGKNEETSKEDTKTEDKKDKNKKKKKTESYSNLSLLTNEKLADEYVGKRPVSIMIPNETSALPQYGITRAGVVYECPAEGGITRFIAFFDDYSDMERLGNVRSCRPYYAYIASEYDSIYVHFGQSVHGEEVLATGVVDDLNGLDGAVAGTVFYRTSDRKAPHNAYTSTDGLNAGIEAKGYRATYDESDSQYKDGHFVFAEKENTLKDGEDVAVVSLYYSYDNPYYIYDEETKLYTRYQFGGQTEVDGIDNTNVTCSNIILQNIDSSIYEGTPYLNIDTTGAGEGKFLTRGKMINITWQKDTNTSETKYYDEEGKEIKLNTGKTWIHYVENDRLDENSFYSTVEEFN